MAGQTTRRRASIGVGMAVGLIAVTAGVWGLQRWAPFADDPERVTWPANVQPLVDFVEETTGERFIEPVKFEFIADAATYKQRVVEQPQPPTQDDLQTAATDEGVARALGLWSGDVSIVDIRTAYSSAKPIPATWYADERSIVVNAPDQSADLSPLLRAELTVRLTQALDDQLFHTVRQLRTAPTSQAYQALLAVSLGHAVWTHDLYVDGLSDDDFERYTAASDERNASFSEAMAEVPIAYRAIRGIGQQIGPMFIEMLSQRGGSLLASALTAHAPSALDQVSLPASKYLRPDPLEAVAVPPAPAGAEVRYSNQMGPFAAYLLFSTGLSAHRALTAADGWGNDRYTAYTLDNRVCVDVHFIADSPGQAAIMETALNAWAHARPDKTGALVGRRANDLYATACDPGTDALQPVPTQAAVGHYLARAQEMQARAHASGDPGLAECVARAFFATYDLAALDESFGYFTELAGIERNCLTAV